MIQVAVVMAMTKVVAMLKILMVFMMMLAMAMTFQHPAPHNQTRFPEASLCDDVDVNALNRNLHKA